MTTANSTASKHITGAGDRSSSSYVPSEQDFDDHHLKYPQRLLLPSSSSTPAFRSSSVSSGASSYSGTSTYRSVGGHEVPRRVRPIAVAPPPGFETSPLDMSGSVPLSVAPAKTLVDPAAQAFGSSLASNPSYVQFVKMRAIAGCLDGDWSSNRPLPEIPSILLADVVRNMGVTKSGGVKLNSFPTWADQQRNFMTTDWSSYEHEEAAMFEQEMMEASQAKEAKKHASIKAAQIVTNPMSPYRNPTGSLSQLSYQNQNHSAAGSRSGLDSRLISNCNNTAIQVSKRRLAPTQITADSIFPAGGPPVPLWRQSEEIVVRTTPTKLQKPSLTARDNEFQKTPRAPKPALDVAQKGEVKDEVTEEKAEDAGGDFTYFHSPTITGSASKPSPQVFENKENSHENFAPIPFYVDMKNNRPKIPPPPKASPEHRLAQRQKQIDIGKNTPEYKHYLSLTPKERRRRGDPITPDKFQDISKRNWEGQVKAWRRRLHCFDPPHTDGEYEAVQAESTSEIVDMLGKMFTDSGVSSPGPPESVVPVMNVLKPGRNLLKDDELEEGEIVEIPVVESNIEAKKTHASGAQ